MALAAPAHDLAATVSLVEALVGRPLRLAEQAIDVLRLDQALEHAKDALDLEIQAEMLRATAAWLAGTAVRPILLITARMLDILDELRALGREEALLELERLGYQPGRRFAVDPLDPAPEGRDVIGYIRKGLAAIGVRIELGLVTADLADAAHDAIARALLAIPGARDLASRVISTALIDGLAQTWEANRDIVSGWEYTAILDGGTCDACAPLDGTIYATLEELFVDLPDFGPNPECLGGGRCRCRAIPSPA